MKKLGATLVVSIRGYSKHLMRKSAESKDTTVVAAKDRK